MSDPNRTEESLGKCRAAERRLRAGIGLFVALLMGVLGLLVVLPAAAQDTTHVRMVDWRFVPPSVEIQPGDVVCWTNRASNAHSVAMDSTELVTGAAATYWPAGAEPWHIGRLRQGETHCRRFRVAGHYAYFCRPHGSTGMIGTLLVNSSSPR